MLNQRSLANLTHLMTLPPAARERLADLLQPLQGHRQPERDRHTVPIGQRAWQRYRDALTEAMERFAANLPLPGGDFNTVRAGALTLTEARDRVLSLLLSAEPFVPFDRPAAEDLIRAIDAALLSCASALRQGLSGGGPSAQLLTAMSWWSSRESPHDDHETLAAAFGLPASPIDANAEFRADWVLQHYAYNNGALLTRVLAHLDSLGVAAVPDTLAGTSLIGGLLDCDNPVAAYTAMDTFVNAYLSAPSDVAERVLAHLRASDAALQRARQMAGRAFSTAVAADNAETRAHALADMYKRISEGSFRQYAWTLHCLRNGTWEPTPMLTSLRERLVAGGGLLAAIAAGVVIPGMRNSEAHETLEWDGIDEEFVTETGRIPPGQVTAAVSEARSFAAGCEAGLAAVRALAIPSGGTFLPDPDEPGRMPAWRRALAYFGTNNLRLTYEHLNAQDAQLHVTQLHLPDINPCFQALLTAHRLLPRIDTFTVSVEDNPATRITVSSDALRATMPIWEHAISSLDRMPFATFLPANLDARRRIETESAAVRSAAWIAIDDVLDAIDGSPEDWDEPVLKVLTARLTVVEIALSQVIQFLGSAGPRLGSVAASAGELRHWLARARPSNPGAADRNESLRRLRDQWNNWGPVLRHPLVPEASAAHAWEARPAVRQRQAYKHFRTI